MSHVIKFCDTLLGDGKTSDPKPSNGSMGQKNSWGPIRDIATLSDYLAFDIISDLCYGKSFGMLQSDKFRSFTKITTTLSRRVGIPATGGDRRRDSVIHARKKVHEVS